MSAGQSRPPLKFLGQRQNDGTRVPPSYGVPFRPRIPALKIFEPPGRAVVGEENDQRVVGDFPFVQFRQQPAEIVVDVFDHAEKLGGVRSHFAGVTLRIFLGAIERGVRRVGRDVGEERRFLFALRIHPVDRLPEKNIGAIALGFHESAVVPNGRIEIAVARRVAATAGISLADAARAVNEHFVEAAPTGLICIFVAQMPFAKNAGRVTG